MTASERAVGLKSKQWQSWGSHLGHNWAYFLLSSADYYRNSFILFQNIILGGNFCHLTLKACNLPIRWIATEMSGFFLAMINQKKNSSPLIHSVNNGSEMTKNSIQAFKCIINHIVFIYLLIYSFINDHFSYIFLKSQIWDLLNKPYLSMNRRTKRKRLKWSIR